MTGGPAPQPKHVTLPEALRAAAAGDEGVTFVDARERERRLGWREVRERARAAAGALRGKGVRRGDRVAIVLGTSPELLDAFFGAQLAGAVPVPLYPPLRLARLSEYRRATARMLAISTPRLLVTDRVIAPLLGDTGVPVLSPRELSGEPFEDEPAELGLIQFSSGTTAAPRAVALTHANLMAQCAAIEACMPHDARVRQRCVSWLPLYHDMGLIGCLMSAVYYPGDLVLIPPEVFLARPWLWLRAIARHRATISPAPSFAYALCADRVRDEHLEGHDLSSWRHALDGAEPVSLDAMRRFAERFARFGFDARALMPVYGLAEASLGVTFTPPGRGARWLGRRGPVSVGRPLPGVEIEVTDERDAPLPDGEVGAIRVRGPAVMAGYYGDPEGSARALRGGWLETGDLGTIVDGELYVAGRAKDVVVVRGANHAPQEIEEALRGVAGLRRGCAVAVGFMPRGAGGEEVLVLAERARDAGAGDDAALAEAARAAILERTGIRPHTVGILEPGSLPRTSSGKLRRAESLRRWQAGELEAPRPPGRLALLVTLVRGWLTPRRPVGAT